MKKSKRSILFKISYILNQLSLKTTTKYNLLRYCYMFDKTSSNKVGLRGKIRFNPFREDKLRIKMEDEVYVEKYCAFQGTGHIEIGFGSTIGERTTIGCSDSVVIGKYVQIASDCSIRDTNHKFDDADCLIVQQGLVTKPIVIEDDVWIAAGCHILSGVTIGKGSVIGAGSVVTSDIPPNSIAVGVPAKVVKKRG